MGGARCGIIFGMRTSSHPPFQYPRALSIAGSDSGGGAGVQADLKTFAALGCHGMTAITALTAQNTLGVRSIHPVPAAFVQAQIEAVAEDIGVDAIKIGMLHSAETVRVVARTIERFAFRHVVLDPVMVASSGEQLMEDATVAALVDELFPLVTLVTPNLDEATRLLGRPVRGLGDLERACTELLALGAPAVLLKGGHLAGAELVDVLAQAGTGTEEWLRLSGPRIHSRNLHGTGCTLSAAVAGFLAQGLALDEAVRRAHAYTRKAIETGVDVLTGAGQGPLNHGHAPMSMQRHRR